MFASLFLHVLAFKQHYAAITRVHLTDPQARQGGKVSVLERGMVFFSPALPMQGCV